MFSDQERRKLQHEIKTYMIQYFKRILGRGVDDVKITIFEDMLIMRLTGFLTEPEKYIVKTPNGSEKVRASRRQVGDQHIIDNIPYFEETMKANVIYQSYDIDPENDFAGHLIVFDHVL
ncbi:MAG TPA: DUF2294 domain-containing protein [Syntrophomonas sp.]|nr:DUF2294 domain-containing protein [Syntrophomonas sp.]